MSARPTNNEALAEALRETPPVLDELARARLERRIVQAAPARRSGAPTRSRAPLVAIGAGAALAVAAAVALVWLRADEPEVPIAHMDLHDLDSAVQRGTLEEGSTVRTTATEEADIRVADTRLRVGGGSRLRIATLSREHIALDLLEGSLRVAYHPRERGRERMSVETPSARVEVVGTAFRVEVRESGTDVSVSEGTVRVVPLDGSEARLVHAGERTHVARPPRAQLAPASATAQEEPAQDEAQAAHVSPDAVAMRPDNAQAVETQAVEAQGVEAQGVETQPVQTQAIEADPAARLERAKRLLARQPATAARILRELTRPSVPSAVRSEAWSSMGDLERSAGRLDQAARAYEHAAQAGRGTAHGHNAIYLLARLHEQRGDVAAARASYARYLREAPRGALAEQARRVLARLGGQADP